MIKYYTLDTETSGLKAGYNEINQISIIRLEDGFQKTMNIAVKNPNRAAAAALEVQQITKADLKVGMPVEDAVAQINDFLEEDGLDAASRCCIGHNVSFDRRFMQAAWEGENKRFPVDMWLCTQKFMKAYVKKVGIEKVLGLQKKASSDLVKVKYTQDMCLVGAGIKPGFGAHNAAIDCQNNIILYNFLMEQNLNQVRIIELLPHKTRSDATANAADLPDMPDY